MPVTMTLMGMLSLHLIFGINVLGASLGIPGMSQADLVSEHPCIFCIEKTAKLLWEMEFNPKHECFMYNKVSPCGEIYSRAREEMLECIRLGGMRIDEYEHGQELSPHVLPVIM